MKKVLLGDTIRLGYDEYVQMAFDGVAEGYYPAENGRFTTYMLRNLTEWERQLFGLGFDKLFARETNIIGI